jgi:pyruvate/2-oxoglutarate dehydrogenase complex dihydrolipoamide acyltransferase (E2) component
MENLSRTKKLTGFQKFSYLLAKEAKDYWPVHILVEIDLTSILEKTEGRRKITSIFLKAIDYVIRKNLPEFPELNADIVNFPFPRVKYFNFISANIPFFKKVDNELVIYPGIINDIHKKTLAELDNEIEENKKAIPESVSRLYKMPIFFMRLALFSSKYIAKLRKPGRGTFVLIKDSAEVSQAFTHPNATLQFVIQGLKGKICPLSINADHRLLHGGITKKFIQDLKQVLEKDYELLLE